MRPADRAPAVSVIMPTYQRRDLARRAVASVVGQSFADFELIVVDDGSTDGTGEALQGLDERLRYHRRKHAGVSQARNAGLRLARGSVLAFLDSDDRWTPDHLAVVVETLERNPSAVLVSTTERYAVGGRQRPGDARLVDALPLVVFECYAGYPSSIAVRREALVAAGAFDERLRVYEDCELFLRLAAAGPFAFLRRRTIVHQDTRGSLVKRGSARGWYLEGEELTARAALALVEGLERPDRAELRRLALARVELVRAFRALVERDDDGARAAIAQACRLAPHLLEAQELVTRRLKKMTADPAERVRLFADAARLWPRPDAGTALFLRWNAIGLALRHGHAGGAVRLLEDMPLRPLPAWALRNSGRWWRLLRRAAQRVRYRGEEAPGLAVEAPAGDHGPVTM